MKIKWPSLSSQNNNENFWTHEYNKHGYCYMKKYNLGDDYKKYFEYSMNLFDKHDFGNVMINAFGQLSGEQSFGVNELNSHLGRVVGGNVFELDCKNVNGKQYLAELRFFFDLELEPFTEYPRRGNCNSSKPIYVDFQ
jgi:hypothetical protein